MYQRIIAQLFELNTKNRIKLGLENMRQMQGWLGDNYTLNNIKSVHVAGTNGKGSVSTKVAKAAQAAGYTVGLFTSPHLFSFRERIQVNGEVVSREEIERHVPPILSTCEKYGLEPTFFEICTLLCFRVFKDRGVNFASIEVGLGGRLDSTNVITPLVSVITSIDMDHMELLGDTREKICREKAGIIKPGVPVVIGPHVPRNVVEEVCREKGSPLTVVPDSNFQSYEAENRAVASCALSQFSHELTTKYNAPPIPVEAILTGLQARPPCRFEQFLVAAEHKDEQPVKVVLDVAHNPNGLQELVKIVKGHFSFNPVWVVMGMSKEKDVTDSLKIMSSAGERFYFVAGRSPRARPPSEILSQISKLATSEQPDVAQAFKTLQAKSFIEHEGNVLRTIEDVIKLAKKSPDRPLVLVCGSFFIMNDVVASLRTFRLLEGQHSSTLRLPHDDVQLNERP